MSKTEVVLKKAKDAGGKLLRVSTAQRSGKAFAVASLEVLDEISVYPPVTPEEAEAFCRVHIKRCNMNLANAKDRGDKRAVINLERKLAVYEYLYKLAKDRAAEINATTTCPNCQVHAVGTDGVCACCGYGKKGSKQNAPYWATEQAYKNGYTKGYADGKAAALNTTTEVQK